MPDVIGLTNAYICGCSMCMCPAIYDGAIIYINDGSWVNRFAGEGSDREVRINQYIAKHGP